MEQVSHVPLDFLSQPQAAQDVWLALIQWVVRVHALNAVMAPIVLLVPATAQLFPKMRLLMHQEQVSYVIQDFIIMVHHAQPFLRMP
jgi:hypothetical protein